MFYGEKEISNLEYFKKLGYIILGILLSIILLFISVEITVFNSNNYKKSFVKYNATEATGMDEENLQHVIEDILRYLKDNRKELDTRTIIRGENRVVFGGREKLHMIDVKELFVKGRNFRNVSLVLFIIMVLFFIKKDKHWKKSISNTLLYTSVINIAFLIILLVLMKTDFNRYFNYFHIIFFDNDLWELDPNTSILVQMFPEGFFYDTAVKIVFYFVTLLIVLGLSGLYLVKKIDYKYNK